MLIAKSPLPLPFPYSSTLYEVPEQSVQRIAIPGNDKVNGKAKFLFIVGFNKDSLDRGLIDVAGTSLVVYLTHQTEVGHNCKKSSFLQTDVQCF